MKQGSKHALRLCVLLMAVLFVAALGVVSFATATEPVEGPVCYHHGDVNSDGVVDSRDAIYTLYNVLLGEEDYPAEQSLDFNGDASMDSRDALYVLYAYMNEDDPDYENKLEGLVHNYYDPTWQWEDGSATVSFKCGCGVSTTLTVGDGVAVTDGEGKAATCVDAGFLSYVAKVTVGGKEYTDTKKITLPAGIGHSMVGTQDCENGSHCEYCDYALEPLGHQWTLAADLSTPATCTTKGVQGYRCSVCEKTRTVEQEGNVGHKYQYLEGQDIDKGNCLFVKQYKCSVCQDVIEGTAESDSYSVHSYKATLTKEATCKAQGEKTYTCTNGCGHSYTEPVAVNDSHAWDAGVQGDGVMLYTCADCGQTKTTVSVTSDEAVDKEALADAQELQLDNNTALAMDDSVVENLAADRQIKISVEAMDLAEVETTKELSAQEKEQIGENKVYDFSMVYADNNDKVEFKGEITVSLPYKLEDGEDIDSIDVWFISDAGELEQVNGTYSNGFVTFTTDHFSYYTVTRLTPAQRCARYGHIPVEAKKQATCTQDGYTMSVCQRCAAELEKEVHKMSGHSFSTEVTAATCDKDGQCKQTCQTCGHTVTEVLPALGHDMKADESRFVTASCAAAGKEVYVCTRENCTYEREDAKPQLEHQFEDFEEKAADCTNKGYKTEKCQLCGEVNTVSETAPLGHEFLADSAVWSWEKDNHAATLVLTCSHDKAHTKTLNAVVTETVVESTCEGDGAVTYTAEASFNNKIFSDQVVITEDAPGHKPGTKWVSDGNQHYHVCEVCQEKVDTAAHNWNSGTVTKQPTCDEAGTKQLQCTVCAYSKEQAIPATGEHTYVNGVCSVCGFKEGSCEHLIMRRKQMDLSGYNICDGAEIWEISCDCGEVKRYAVESFFCVMGDGKDVEAVAPNGQTIEAYAYTCEKCGLSYIEGSYSQGQADPCVGSEYYWVKMTMGDQLVLEFSNSMMEDQEHLAYKPVGEVDLTAEEYGLCAEKLEILECACGENRTYSVAERCEWTWDDSYNGSGSRYYCENCGVTKTYSYSEPVVSGCMAEESATYTYEKDGKTIYTYTNVHFYGNHDYELTSYEKLGESCEDGIIVRRNCSECGETDKYFADYHAGLLRETIDLSSYGFCYGSVIQATCVCDEKIQWYDYDYDNGNCSWVQTGYDEETNTESYICETCQITRTVTTVYGEKDENCQCLRTETVVFADKDGNKLATVYEQGTSEEHDMVRTGELLGESCEDGVRITNACAGCGYSYSYTDYYHESMDRATYDLSEYGLCGGTAVIRGCLCGENTWINFNNTACSWNFIRGEEFAEIYQCETCGVQRVNSWKDMEFADPCMAGSINTFTFTKDGQQLLSISYEDRWESHSNIYELTLNAGSTSCEDGFTVASTCTVCGETDSWRSYGHETFTMEREILGEGVLCGPMICEVRRCACGKYSDTDVYWQDDDNRCYFYEHYDQAAGKWIYQCETCGVVRTSASTEEPIEGQTCRVNVIDRYTFSKDGQDLFSYDRTYTRNTHEWVTSFRLIGTTCDEGYYVTRICQKCGQANEYSEPEYGCSNYTLERTEVYSDEAICGPVYLVRNGCACGAVSEYGCDYSCYFQSYGYDSQLQEHLQKCVNCGVLRSNSWLYDRVEDSCQEKVTMQYRFYRDGALLTELKKEFYRSEHELLYTFDLAGESCEDGYSVSYQCMYCDYTGSETDRYDHNTCMTEYYDLADYGVCDGYIFKRNCACGLYSYREWNMGCQWQDTGNTDPDTGASEHYCSECDAYWYYLETEELDRENCVELGTAYFKWVRDDQTLFETTIQTSSRNHEYAIAEVVFDVEGGDCDSGYTITLQCKNCGVTETEWSNGHNYYETEVVYLSELGGCGGTITLSQCPCGKYGDVDFDWKCSTDYDGDSTGDDFNGTDQYTWTCTDCGMTYREDRAWSIPEGGCHGTSTVKATLTIGQTVKELNWANPYEYHTYVVASASLNDPEAGCEGGFTIVQQCQRCDETRTRSGNGHGTYLTERLYLSELDACGGYVDVYQCACGQNGSVQGNWNCDMSNIGGKGDGDELGGYSENLYACADCGLQVLEYEQWTYPADSCFGTTSETYTLTMGETERVLTANGRTENHEDLVTGFVLTDPEQGCEGGYTATIQCIRCGESYTTQGAWHSSYNTERLDLSALGACGGSIYKYQCACGEYSGVSTGWNCSMDYTRDYQGDNREGTETYTYTCQTCSLKYVQQESWSIPEGQCVGVRNGTATVSLNDQTDSFTYASEQEDHNWKAVYTLQPGAVSCEDGVDVYNYCTECDASSSGYSSWHNTTVVESIDLAQYGSVCGGSLDRYACACGERQHFQFSEDMLCDLNGSQSIPVWIEGTLDEGQYTSDGWSSTYSYANMFICAVTDPQCGLTIRNASYWLQEGCQAVQYETWQLGYDAATGTCLREITVPTGEKRAYHSYTQTAISETSEEGYTVTGTMYTCSDCGSTYYEKDYYDGNNRVKWEREAVNTLDNGERQYWYERYDYMYAETANGTYSFTTLERIEYVYANGESYWYQYAYDYNFEDSCKRTQTYSNSNGSYEVSEDTCHRISSDYVYLTEPTCSQHGVRQWTETCWLCGMVTDTYDEELEPEDHSFYWDSSKEIYVCYNCGLENTNGSSGAIIMEDLSTDTDYVVGYCNCNEVEFQPYVSVILYDVAEGENDELVLQFNDARFLTAEEDGICAVAYNAEKVDMYTAMAIAEAGYTGSYAVRISFVPVNGESTLDYAITFDTQSAQ